MDPSTEKGASMKSSWQTIELWFERVFDLPPGEQAGFLERECPDPEVRAEVLGLLEAGARSGDAFEPSDGYRRSLGGGFVPTEDASGRLVGRYRLDSLLGRGGMGTVWLAHRNDQAFDQQVAVKLVKRGLDTEETLRRFRHERQVLAGLEHPGIARLIDGGATDDGLPYMVLEYVEGTPIDRWCQERSLGLRERLALFRAVCEAVQFAHQNLVVHRDLKPNNILIGKEGAPKLLDFGIAKMLDPQAPGLTGSFPGSEPLLTPEYASPEQVCGLPVTTSTDVYSLGVVLYQLLTGALPYRFEGRGAQAVEQVVCHEEPRRPSSVPEPERPTRRRELLGDLDTIVLKALRKSPERRYASVEQLSEDLRRYLVGLPVLAQPDSLGYRARKFVGRHRGSIGALVLVFVTLTVSLIVIAGLLSDARAAEAAAKRRFDLVQSLANEVIFDLHDAIEQVPGATAARHKLVETGLRYLDGLAGEAGEDPDLLNDLARGYARLAEVQGRPTAASLGQAGLAYESYGRALAILARLLELRPDDEVRLLQARYVDLAGTLELRLGRTADALASFERSTPILRDLGHATDLVSGLFHQMEALTQLGRTEAAIAMGGQCLEVAREDVSRRPENRDAKRTLHTVISEIAELRLIARDMTQAEAEMLEALEIAEQLHALAPDERQAKRDLALTFALLARLRMEDGRPAEAEELVTRQLAMFEGLSTADGANLQATRDLVLAYERLGTLHQAQDDLEAAMVAFQRCVTLDREVVEAAPHVAEWQRDLAASYDRVALVALNLGRLTEAREFARLTVEQIAPLAAADPEDMVCARLLAMSYFRMAQLDLESGALSAAGEGFAASVKQFATLAAADGNDAWSRRLAMVAVYYVGWVHREQGNAESLDAPARQEHLRAAVVHFERALELIAELDSLGMLQSGDHAQAEAIKSEIAACRESSTAPLSDR
jgi:eukaryotic-like serine/threonine-protein kinase